MKIEGNPLPDLVRVQAVLTVLDAAGWLADATGDRGPIERLLTARLDDDRTLAQLAVGQAEFADAIIVAGAAADLDTARRTDAVLDRLVPVAPRVRATRLDVEALLAAVPANSRRGRVDDAHAVLTHHTHPWHTEQGVGTVLFGACRPFHPERLHDALQILLQGVVRVRGRMWVATQPDQALAVESAGSGLRVAQAGRWLSAVPDWSDINVERALMASLRWDDQFEDREQALLIIYHVTLCQGGAITPTRSRLTHPTLPGAVAELGSMRSSTPPSAARPWLSPSSDPRARLGRSRVLRAAWRPCSRGPAWAGTVVDGPGLS